MPSILKVFLAVLVVGCAGAPVPVVKTPGAPRTVVLVSMDGIRHDYPLRVNAPTFARLAAEGASADRLIPPYPSQTFPSHASLATGVTADRHGILNNRFKDRVRGEFSYGDDATWYDAMPLWVHSTRNGIRTHVFHWVGSRGPWQGTEPAEARLFDKSVTDDEKVDTVLEWLGRAQDPPRLIMSYWLACDKAGHEDGPDAESVNDCMRATDTRLNRLQAGLAALPQPVALLVVSDHGMTATQGEVDLYSAFEALDFAVEIIPSGPVAHVFVAPEHVAAAATLARTLPHVRTWLRDEVPAELHYRHPTRTGDLLLATDYGWHFDGRKGATLPGHHGHDPEQPEMGAIFRAWGDGIVPGSRAVHPRAVDLMPTICRLLGIPVPEGADEHSLDGRVLNEILTPALQGP